MNRAIGRIWFLEAPCWDEHGAHMNDLLACARYMAPAIAERERAAAEAKRARKRHARLHAAGIRPCRCGGFPGERCPGDPNWSAEDCRSAHGAYGDEVES